MIKQKENDWVLNILSNDQLSLFDFKDVGLTAENTSLLDEDTYKKSKQIQENPLFQNDSGEFDQNKFHKFYEQAEKTYNYLADETYLDQMKSQMHIFGKDNIFAPTNMRKDFNETVQYAKISNPERDMVGLVRYNQRTPSKYSMAERAQREKKLLNPLEAEKDPSKAQWGEAPNDSWFDHFFDTFVIATWDSDGTHIDPVTGETVEHKKGEQKLNENGVPFYESLDGRDVYGKQILHKFDTLTKDGSTLNKYDFFDSDGKDKSAVGTLAKNIALVGSMFIPYVGPWIAGLSVATQSVGLLGTLGKMALGSDSPTFNMMEGWSKSVNRQYAKSEHAQQNTWCWENFINMMGDVAGQLKEQRFLFEYAPALIKGNKVVGANGISAAKQGEMAKKAADEYNAINNAKIADLISKRTVAGQPLSAAEVQAYSASKVMAPMVGQKAVENFMKDYQHIGSVLSKAYMTAITVGDTYGEAKAAGASDLEATLLTLGYGAAEAALLNSEIGQWILPELKNSGIKTRNMIKQLVGEVPEQYKITNKVGQEAKKDITKWWFKLGQKLHGKMQLEGKNLAGQALAGGLSEGFEETAEEALADFSKGAYNVVQWLKGTPEHYMDGFGLNQNTLDRYLMSFVGGAAGGGMTAVGTNFNINNTNMSTEQARQELVYMLRNGKKEEIYSALNQVNLANPYLSSTLTEQDDGSMVYKPATDKSESMDAEVKRAFIQNVEAMDDIIKTEGIKLTDERLLDQQTFNDFRLARLQQSNVASLYLQDFNNLNLKLLAVKDELNNLIPKDDSSKLTEEQEQRKAELNKQLLDLRAQKDQYLNGEKAIDFTAKALFELTPYISSKSTPVFFKDYVKRKTGKDIKDLSDDDIKELRTEYNNYKNTEAKNDIDSQADLYLTLARNSGQFIQEFAANYDNIRRSKSIPELVRNHLKSQEINLNNTTDEDSWLEQAQGFLEQAHVEDLVSLIDLNGTPEQKTQLEALVMAEDSEGLANFMYNTFITNPETFLKSITSAGAINPEIKNSLLNLFDQTKLWFSGHEVNVNAKKAIDRINNDLSGLYSVTPAAKVYEASQEITNLINTTGITDETIDSYLGVPDFMSTLNRVSDLLGKPVEEITFNDLEKATNKTAELKSNLLEQENKVKGLTYTDTVKFIQNFVSKNYEPDFDLVKTLETVNALLYQNQQDLTNVNLESSIQDINRGIEILDMLESLVRGAQTDTGANLENMFGYNVTLNTIAQEKGVKDWLPLPQISVESSDIINQDIDIIRNKLKQAKAIYEVNSGKKLNLQTKAKINKQFIDFNRLKKFIVDCGDGWKDKDKLEKVIDDAVTLQKYAEKRDQSTLTADEKEAIERETLAIDSALYDFFQSNKEAVDNGEIYSMFSKGFNLYTEPEQRITESTEYLNDRNFLYYLASRAAIRKPSFYKALKGVISDEYAPLYSQEEAVFQNIAQLLNGNVITKFQDAFIKARTEDFNKLSETDKHRVLRDKLDYSDKDLRDKIIKSGDINNTGFVPQFKNIYMTEGAPGTGKSSATLYYTTKILQSLKDKTLLSKVWFAHTTKPKAEQSLSDLGIEDGIAFDKNSLMQKIYSKYNSSRTVSKGSLVYSGSEFSRDPATNMIQFAETPDNLTDIPSLIIIDEISHYDQADLNLLDKFAQANGITVLTAGDFDQSSTVARASGFEGNDLELKLSRSHLKHSPKLGISMRTTNSQMDKSINSTLTWLSDPTQELNLFHNQTSDEGLKGVKALQFSQTAEIESTINNMLDTKDKDKIGFIYYDESSPLYQKYKDDDRFDFKKGSAAQGSEGKYYIIDLTGNDSPQIANDLYTGITRSQQGALLIKTASQKINNHLELISTNTGFNPKSISNYSKLRKELLDKLISDDTEELTYTPTSAPHSAPTPPPAGPVKPTIAGVPVKPPVSSPPSTASSSESPAAPSTTESSTVATWTFPEKVMEITLNGETYRTDGIQVYDSSSKEVPEDIKTKVLEIFNNLKKEPVELTVEDEHLPEKVNETNQEQNAPQPEPVVQGNKLINFTYLLHSHNTFELGVGFDSNGKIQYLDSDMKRYKYRIDSVNGLVKVFETNWQNPTNDIYKYIDIIKNLRSTLFSAADKQELITGLSYILNNSQIAAPSDLQVSDVEFGLVSVPNISKRNASTQKWGYSNTDGITTFLMLDKSSDERTINNFNPDPDASAINRKTFTATITLENGKRVAIPLFVLGNLKSYTTFPENPVSQVLASIFSKYPDRQFEAYNEILNDPVLGKIPEIANLAKLYLFTSAGYFKIDDPNWLPGKDLHNWGIQVNSESDSGGNLPYNGESTFTPITTFMQNSTGYTFSKQVYSVIDNIEDKDENEVSIANFGQAFVLVSNDPKIVTDEQMQAQLQKQRLNPDEQKKVTLVYVLPPKVSIKDYLDNLYKIISKSEDKVLPLGNHTTSFKVWKALLPEISDPNSEISKLLPASREKIMSEITRIQGLEGQDLLNELMSDQDWSDVGGFRQSLQKQLNYQLFNIMETFPKGQSIKNTETLAKLIENGGLSYIFYSCKFKDKEPKADRLFIPMQSDQDASNNSMYTINGLPFSINAKLDSPLFMADQGFNNILQSFVDKIVDRGPRNTTKDTFNYVNGINKTKQTQQPKINTFEVMYDDKIHTLMLSDHNTITYEDGTEVILPPNWKYLDHEDIRSELRKKSNFEPSEEDVNIVENYYNTALIQGHTPLTSIDSILTNQNLGEVVGNDIYYVNSKGRFIKKSFNNWSKNLEGEFTNLFMNEINNIEFKNGKAVMQNNEMSITLYDDSIEVEQFQEEGKANDYDNLVLAQGEALEQMIPQDKFIELLGIWDNGETLADLKGDDNAIEILEENLDPSDTQLNDIIKYLKDEPAINMCSVKIRL